MNEDDTFRVLSRVSYQEMQRQRNDFWSSGNIEFSPAAELILFEKNHWTLKEFLSEASDRVRAKYMR